MIQAHHFRFLDQPLLQREYESFGFDRKKNSAIESIDVQEIETYEGFQNRNGLRTLSGRVSFYLSNIPFENTGKEDDWGLEVENVLSLVWESKNRRILYGKGEKFTPELLQFWIYHTFFPIVLELQRSYKMLHVGAVEIDGEAVFFSAPSSG